jgi:cytochrome c biogenesis protein CcdA
MPFKVAADLVVVFHLLWILFLVFGAFIGRHVFWVKWLHLSALTFSVLLQLFHWTCPLTFLEVSLRRRHDPDLGYAGDFLAHYAERLVYMQISPSLVFIATVMVVGLSAWAYRPGRSRKPWAEG